MSDTPRTDDQIGYAGSTMSAIRIEFARQLERELNAANQRIKQMEDARTVAAANSLANMLAYEDAVAKIKRLGREVELLRLYGNKDCTAQADEVLKKEAKP